MNSSSQCQNCASSFNRVVMRWRISVCLHFSTQGTVIDMVWLSYGLH